MRNIKYKIALSLNLCLFFALSSTIAQSVANIATTETGPGLRTAIIWSHPQARIFHIYRKDALSASYPSTPIATVKPVTDCSAIKALLVTEKIALDKLLADRQGVRYDVCLLPGLDPASEKYQRFLFLAQGNLTLTKMAGLAFEDVAVTANQTYWYKITAVNSAGQETGIVASDLTINAGKPELPAAPVGLVAEAGDNEVLLRWSDVQKAAGYRVWRSQNPGFAGSDQVNPNGIYYRMNQTLQGNALTPPLPGFLDFQRWDTLSGNPIPHIVNKKMIGGPTNGVTYYYRIQAVDLFGRAGETSNIASATPQDHTEPVTPAGLKADADNSSLSGGVAITFNPVNTDVNAHPEQSGIRYEVRRFSTALGNPDSTPSQLVALLPTGATSITDTNSELRGPLGDRIWYYRVRAIDAGGNKSKWSAATAATVKDLTAPSVPTGLKSAGFEKGIALQSLDNNLASDVSEIQIWRGFCDYGKPDTCVNINHTITPCNRFIYLGSVSRDSMKRAEQSGRPFFFDSSIPEGSPVCYAYWIKLVDRSGNRSGSKTGYPNLEEQAQIICERLRDSTPPVAAIITGLFSGENSIRIEIVAPPNQDVWQYLILRAPETTPQKEPSAGDFKWIGGLAILSPGASLVPINAPLGLGSAPACSSIPAAINEKMTSGSFLDMTAAPHITYWYKVIAMDYEGNKTLLENAVAVSTFTFTRKTQSAPNFGSLTEKPDLNGVSITWSPSFDSTFHRGFLLFKGLSADGPFVQLSTLLQNNSYLDRQVVMGRKYWYKVVILQQDGKISPAGNGEDIIQVEN